MPPRKQRIDPRTVNALGDLFYSLDQLKRAGAAAIERGKEMVKEIAIEQIHRGADVVAESVRHAGRALSAGLTDRSYRRGSGR